MKPATEGRVIAELLVILLSCGIALWLIQVCGPYSHYVGSGASVAAPK